MAKIEHSFTMRETPERAQWRFREDIAPGLHREAGFSLCDESPGCLSFSDGITASTEFAGSDVGSYEGLRRAFARRIKVAFELEGTGTKVTIRGHVERDVRSALELLGRPGHWPDAEGLAAGPA